LDAASAGSRRRLLAADALGRGVARDARVAALAGRTQELEGLRVDLGRLPLVAVLVLPVPRAELALDVDGAALVQVAGALLGGLRPRHDPMPLGALFAVAVAVREDVGRSDREVGHRLSALGVAELGVAPEVADQDHLVDARHVGGSPEALAGAGGAAVRFLSVGEETRGSSPQRRAASSRAPRALTAVLANP